MTDTKNKHYKAYGTLALLLSIFYSPVYLSNYAFSDDWTYLYASSIDPYSIFKWDVLSGRPLYGVLRYLCSHLISSTDSLIFLRLFSVFSLIVLSCYFYKFASDRNIVEDKKKRLVFSLLLCLLPSFQVFNAWTVCFPYVTSILLSGLSYSTLSKAKGFVEILLSAFLLIASFAIYQPTAMCFLFFAFMDICLSHHKLRKKELLSNFLMISFGMFTALILSKLIPLQIYNISLARTDITLDLIGKAKWFITEPLKNSVCNFDTGRKFLYIILSLLIMWVAIRKINNGNKIKAYLAIAFIFVSSAPNLLVSESWAAYRTISASSLITTSLFLLGLFNLIDKIKFSNFIYIILPVVAGILAINNIRDGFSVPQQKEYELLNTAINRMIKKDFTGKVYYRLSNENLPKIAKSTKYDEFGALSLGMPWTFAGMAAAVRKNNGMQFKIPESPVIVTNDSCLGDCIVIDTKTILLSK
ncbi:hypothetical protein ACQPT2_04230 [Erwinia amylovora]